MENTAPEVVSRWGEPEKSQASTSMDFFGDAQQVYSTALLNDGDMTLTSHILLFI